jgi:hypothetical protein
MSILLDFARAYRLGVYPLTVGNVRGRLRMLADRRGHQMLISSTSVRTSLGASGCDKSKHQRAETKHGNQDANDQIVAAIP